MSLNRKRTVPALAILLSTSLALTACGGQATSNNNAPANNASSTPSGEPEKPLEIKWLGNGTAGMYPEENGYIVQELNKRFNVKLQPVKADSAKDQELSMLFASGEIPDHMLVAANSIGKVLDQGAGRTMPVEMIKEFAPNVWKSTLLNYPQLEQMSIYKDGKLLALPEGTRELFPFTTVRTDWLAKVGAKMPTNLEEFKEVAKLFTTGDPDGDGKNNTYAFSLSTGFGNVYTLAAAFGISLPAGTVKDDTWIKDNNGNLIRAQVSENYKSMVAYMADLYKSGYIHPDVTIKDQNALFSDGIVGMRTVGWTSLMPKYRPSDWFALTFKKNPQATTDYLPPLKGPGGKDAVFENQSAVWRYMVAGKNTTDAQLKKILQILDAQLVDKEVHNLVWRGTEGVHFTLNDEGMAELTKDYSSNEKQAETGIKFFIINNRNAEQFDLSFGKIATVQADIQKKYKTVDQLIPAGTIIKSHTEFGADVQKVEDEFFIKAATGSWDVNAEWDNYVKRWNAAGGDKITKEINEVYKKLKK
jgi:putative aldouronate transport system substrate-binding protein